MSKVLGLDLGTNSIGWAIVDHAAKQHKLQGYGVHIFSEGVKIEKGQESSKAAERTEKRSARRLKFRRRLRKYETLKALVNLKMCPLSLYELDEWRKNKNAYPKNPEFINWLLTDNVGDKEERKKKKKNPYFLRAKAAERKLTPFDLGRAFYHIAQRRGFLSNRLEADSESDNEKGKVKSGINKITSAKGDKTLGQYFYDLYLKGYKIRTSYTSREEHYLEEFNKICQVQEISSDAKLLLERAIFYQRPLKSQKGLVGKCSLEKDKARCPVSHPLFEEFRALQFINSIAYIDESGSKKFLSKEERKKLWLKFLRKPSNKFEFSDLEKVLIVKNEERKFNYKPFISIAGCPLLAELSNIFGENFKNILSSRYKNRKDKSEEEVLHDIWHVLFTFDKTEKLKEFATEKLECSKEEAEKFSKIKVKNDYASLSLKAIKKILPFLREGLLYTHAVFLANIEKVVGSQIWKKDSLRQEIISNITSIINNYGFNKKINNAINDLIGNFKKEYDNSHTNYSLDEEDIKAVRKKCLEYFPSVFSNKLKKQDQEQIVSKVEIGFQSQLRKKRGQFIKNQRLDEEIQNYLKESFRVSDYDLTFLYHPSDIEIFKEPKRSPDGNLYLGSPMIPSVKNPMAMRTLHQLRKLINELISEEKINEETIVQIELARELNDKNKRQAIQRWQRENEQERDKYKKEIVKLYKEATGKTIEPGEREILKYKCWQEQGKICLYTGKNIGVADFLGQSPTFDIEHTIPRSFSYDNSDVNITLCEMKFNREVKGVQIPFDLSNHSEICGRIIKWEEKTEDLKKQIQKVKARVRASATKEDKDKAIQYKHYLQLQLKYWEEKVIRFKTKSVPEKFKNSQLVDTGIITKFAKSYLKSVFPRVDAVKGTAVAEFRKLWGLQPDEEPKSRAKHSHHTIDAIVIAALDRQKYDFLTHYYKADEKGDKKEKLNTKNLLLPWPSFTQDVLSVENSIIVSHHTPDNFGKKSKRKLRVRGKIVKGKDGKPVYQKGDTVRGSLHEETFYGAIKKQVSFDNNNKPVFEKEENGVDDKVFYVRRKKISELSQSNVDNIVDPVVKEKVKAAIAEKGFKKALSEEIWMNEEKKVEIKKVRYYTSVKTPIHLKKHRDLSKHSYKQDFHVTVDGNYIMGIYEGKTKSGKVIPGFDLASDCDAGKYFKESNTNNKKFPLVPDNIVSRKCLLNLSYCLTKGTMVLFYKESPDEVWGLDNQLLSRRLYKVYGFEKDGRVLMRFHLEARPDKELGKGDNSFNFDEPTPKLRIRYSSLNCLVQNVHFTISKTGKIRKI